MSGVYVTKQGWNGIVSVRIRFLIAQISSRADTRGGANNPKGLSFLLQGVALDLSSPFFGLRGLTRSIGVCNSLFLVSE